MFKKFYNIKFNILGSFIVLYIAGIALLILTKESENLNTISEFIVAYAVFLFGTFVFENLFYGGSKLVASLFTLLLIDWNDKNSSENFDKVSDIITAIFLAVINIMGINFIIKF